MNTPLNPLRRFGRGLLAAVVAALSAALLSGAGTAAFAQSAGLPLVTPASMREGTATALTVRAQVNAANLIAGSVNVQQVGPTGLASVLGPLNDNGVAGDVMAGDGIYSGQVMVPAAGEGTLGIRVSFATRGSLRRTVSPSFAVAVLPADAPVATAAVDLTNIVLDPVSGAQIASGMANACFVAGTPYAAIRAIGLQFGGVPVGGVPLLGHCFQFRLPVAGIAAVTAAVAVLAARPEVLLAEPEHVLALKSSCAVGNPFCTDINFTHVLGLAAAHNYGEGQSVTGQSVKVGILDTGMAAAHLAGSTLFPGLVVGSNFITPGTPPADDHPNVHGTTVAAIVQATAPRSTLIVSKVLNAQNVGNESAVVAGMVEAAIAGAKVVNLSLGGLAQTLWMRNAITTIQNAGVIIVAAAGNEGTSTRLFPAAHLNVIAVGNTDQRDVRWAGPVDPSNFGFWVNIAAPGVDVAGTPGATGTSFSSPWVTGTVALMLAKYGVMSTAQVRDQLFRTALPIAASAGLDQCPAQPCNQDLGAGRVDPAAVLGAIRLTRVTAVGASGSFIPRMIDVSVRTAAGATLFQTTMTFLGQATGCQVVTVVSPPCIATVPFDFAALPAGNYQLRVSFAAQAASYFGAAQLTAPGARFTSVASGTGGINAADPTRADYSLFGAGTSRTTIFNISKP